MMTGLRITAVVVALAGIIVWSVWWRRNKGRELYAVPPLSWLAHVLIFYICRLAGYPDNQDFVSMWSSIIHLHALILLSAGALVWLETNHDRGENG